MIICPWKDISRYEAVIPGLKEAVAMVNSLESFEPATYPLPECGGRVLVQHITTKNAEGALLEAHKNFLDIQYIPEETETMGWAPIEKLEVAKPYNDAKDVWHFAGDCDLIDIRPGYCYVVYPEDAHAPSVHIGEGGEVNKIVIKLKV